MSSREEAQERLAQIELQERLRNAEKANAEAELEHAREMLRLAQEAASIHKAAAIVKGAIAVDESPNEYDLPTQRERAALDNPLAEIRVEAAHVAEIYFTRP